MKIIQPVGVTDNIDNLTITVSTSGCRNDGQSPVFASRVNGVVLVGKSMGVNWTVELDASELQEILRLVPEDLRR